MEWFGLSSKRARLLSHAALALGLWIAPVVSAVGAERPCRPSYQCPPGYRHMAPSQRPYYEGAPGEMPTAPAPDGQQPTEPGQTPQQPDQAADQQAPQQPQQDFNAPQTSRASLAPGADTPQLGRLDFANRMNLFDNMTAAPQNKIWFGYQRSSGIQTGVKSAGSAFGFSGSSFTAEQRQANYRVGAEYAFFDDFSIAVQGQYYSNLVDGSPYSDDWSQPQIMAKYVVCRDCDTILSATLGLQPETNVEFGDFQEATTRIYPGMLYYETCSPNLFTQGGFQFGIPFDDDAVHTFDWSISLGYWLYRDCGCDNRCDSCCGGYSSCCGNSCCGSCNSCCDSCCGGCGDSCTGWITGIVPQVGLLGKHVIGDNTITNAYGFGSGFVANELTDVVDLTVGGLVIIACDWQVGLGYSIPLTDSEVREEEFISYVNYLF